MGRRRRRGLLERAETRAFVRAQIDKLPDNYRTVLLLRDIEEMSTPEAADALGITENAVKIRLHRARQALRALIDERLRPASSPDAGEDAIVTCRELTEFIIDYLDGELPPEVHAPLRAAPQGAVPRLRMLPAAVLGHGGCRARRLPECEGEIPADVPEELIAAILDSRRRAE